MHTCTCMHSLPVYVEHVYPLYVIYCLTLLSLNCSTWTQVVTAVRKSWNDLRSIPLSYRLAQLRALKAMVEENITKFEEALWTDLRKVHTYRYVPCAYRYGPCIYMCIDFHQTYIWAAQFFALKITSCRGCM